MGKPTPCIAGGGHLAAIAAVLQLVGSAIRFGPFSVSLVLIPHCAGHRPVRLRHGLLAGAGIRGRGASVGGRRPLSGGRSGGAIVTVLSKGIVCGAAAGLCCRWLHPRYPRLSILLSALAAPLVNTGVVLLGYRLFFMPLIHQWAQQAGYAGAGVYLMVGMLAVPAHWRSPVAWAASWRPCAAGGRLRRGSAAA